MGYSLDGPEAQKEIEAVSPEDVRADFQYCMQANPTLSLVGEETVIKAAFEAGWK